MVKHPKAGWNTQQMIVKAVLGISKIIQRFPISITFFLKIGSNRSSFYLLRLLTEHINTQLNFHPPPGFEPGSLGTVSRWLIRYATVPHNLNKFCLHMSGTPDFVLPWSTTTRRSWVTCTANRCFGRNGTAAYPGWAKVSNTKFCTSSTSWFWRRFLLHIGHSLKWAKTFRSWENRRRRCQRRCQLPWQMIKTEASSRAISNIVLKPKGLQFYFYPLVR